MQEKFIIASGPVIIEKGRLLVNRDDKDDFYKIPGGRVKDSDSSLEQTCIREAKEESGLDIEVISPFDKSKTANLVQPVHIHLDHIKEDHKHINLIYA